MAMFVAFKIRDCQRNRLGAGPAASKVLTEALTGTSLTERCGQIVIFPDENQGTSGVRSPDKHLNESRMTLCRAGSSGAVRVSSAGTSFLTMVADCLTKALPTDAFNKCQAALGFTDGEADAARVGVLAPVHKADRAPDAGLSEGQSGARSDVAPGAAATAAAQC